MKEIFVDIESHENLEILFGNLDSNLRLIEKEFNVRIKDKDDKISIKGDDAMVDMVEHLIPVLRGIISSKKELTRAELQYAINMEKQNNSDAIKTYLDYVIVTTYEGKALRPKTIGQKEYVDSIEQNGIVFGIGPAGTGKTYLAMAKAVQAFKNKEVSRIILTRPAVEAGESLGFLPGDLQEKIDPYLRPLYDALFEIMGPDTYQKLMERGQIEVAPLAYMRGRTLDNSFIILDEAQNTTKEQMKMFLTRLGYGSKAVITGDITQLDLPIGKKSGLITIRKILSKVEGIKFIDLDRNDVVRHPLVQRIIDAYEEYEKKHENTEGVKGHATANRPKNKR